MIIERLNRRNDANTKKVIEFRGNFIPFFSFEGIIFVGLHGESDLCSDELSILVVVNSMQSQDIYTQSLFSSIGFSSDDSR